MVGVDERREGRLGGVVPFACCRFAARILRRRDDLEVRVLELVVQCLPAWQIKSAPSPGGPRDQAAPSCRGTATSERCGPCRSGTATSGAMRDSRKEPRTTGISPKLQTRAAGSATTLCPARRAKRREVELVASDHGRRDRDANISAAGTLRLQFEFIDPREITLQDPQRVRNAPGVRPDVTQADGATVVQHGRPGRRLTLTVAQMGTNAAAPTAFKNSRRSTPDLASVKGDCPHSIVN